MGAMGSVLARPGAEDIQLDLILDYRSNVKLYPSFQSYFREHRPPLLAVWGRHDPAFVPAGAYAYQRDLPDAHIHLLDTGHFALETHEEEIATLIRAFFHSEPVGRSESSLQTLERSDDSDLRHIRTKKMPVRMNPITTTK